MEKKSKELDCLRQAVTLGLRKRGKTKEFFKAVEAGLKDKDFMCGCYKSFGKY